MTASRKVEIGQRYRTVRAGGTPLPTIWEVVKVFQPWHDGFEHACLKCVGDQGGTMTLATSVISDKTRFVRNE